MKFYKLKMKKLRLKTNILHFFNFKFLIFNLYLLFILGLAGCGSTTTTSVKPTPKSSTSPAPEEEKGPSIVINGAVLDNYDEVGRPIWKVRANKSKYDTEKKMALVQGPDAELFQDGKVIYKVQAQQAEIEQDGKLLFLKGKIVATDPNNGVVLRGNELEWRPQQDLLVIRNQIIGSHKQMQAVAQEAKVKTRENRIEFTGGVAAKSVEPPLQMKTEHLIWQVKQETLIADRPVQMDRYQGNQITDRGRGDSAEVNLKTKIANITKNAQIEMTDPPLQIASNAMTWNFNNETVQSSTKIRVYHRVEQLNVTANQGELKIPEKIVYLNGDVNAIGDRRQSLRSKSLVWFLNKQLVEAQGDVAYRQGEPPLTFTGEKAVGNLESETIAVSAGQSNGGKVVTEIIPQGKFLNP
jgi:LPS export ABC transporter protein LptC